MAKDIKTLLRDAKLPERTVVLCLNQDLNSALEDKERQLDEKLQGPNMASLNGAAFPELRAEIEDIKDQMADSKIEFKFRALTRNVYTAMIKDNPPKDDDEIDTTNGFDWDKVTDALIHQCLVEPALDEDDWMMLLGDGTDENPGVLSSVQYDLLATVVWRVNRRDVDVPFSPGSLLNLRTSVKP